MDKKVIVALIALVVIANAASVQDVLEWQAFKDKFNKSYNNIEDPQHMNIFLANKQHIDEHNSLYDLGQETYTMAVNNFTDWSNDEFSQFATGFAVSTSSSSVISNVQVISFIATSNASTPSSLDWRKNGAVTAVKDQGHCGSCWAFSATGALEAQQFRSTGRLISLSEQNLIDCTGGYGNKGCDSGNMNRCFQYVKVNNGIDTEASYPYEADEGECRYTAKDVGATDAGYVRIQAGSEADLVAALVTYGPIAVGIDASTNFHKYSSGIFYDAKCSSSKMNHAVLVVGYDQDANGNQYYIVKNSWGTIWGQQGYVFMARNRKNNCGIASHASVPIV